MIKLCIGEEVFLISFKTLKCTPKDLCILWKNVHFYQFGCTDSPPWPLLLADIAEKKEPGSISSRESNDRNLLSEKMK